MRRALACSLLGLLLCSCASTARPAAPLAAPRLEVVCLEEGGPFGYREPAGEVVLPARYLMAEEFTPEGIAAVVDGEGWAYIDRTGRVLVRPFDFDNGPDPFVEGLSRCVSGGRYGFFDPLGQVVISPRFDWAEAFSEGRAAVCQGCRREVLGEHWTMRGGRWGYVDQSGALVIPLAFERAESFSAGRAAVEQGGEAKVIDSAGRVID